MGKDSIVPIIIAVLSLLTAISAQRQSAKATRGTNETAVETTTIASRTDMETEAYVRASKIYTDTIDRQTNELKEVREEIAEVRASNRKLEERCEDLEDQNDRLRERVIELEKHEREHHEH